LAPPVPPSNNVSQLHVRGLSAEIEGRCIRDISFELAAGEIIGIAGVSGNGQFTLGEALAGLIPISAGDVILGGISLAGHVQDGAIADDVAYIPERPIDNAVVAELDVALNLSLRHARQLALFAAREKIVGRARELMQRYDVRPAQPGLQASSLSGGN